MLENINIENVLFLDIETVPQFQSYEHLDDRLRKLWDKKAEYLKKNENETPDALYGRAGIYAEFGKVICVSAGFLKNSEFRIKSFYGHNEKELLQNFAALLNQHYAKKEHNLCAHNGKEFDFPYLCRRMLVNDIKLPLILNNQGKKPWETGYLDTLDLWKFGDYKNFTSLELLAAIFDVPTPKDDIEGSQVAEVYYKLNDLHRIMTYCCKDVLTVAQLFLRFRGEPLLTDAQIRLIE
jgi:3'-5' exonuclease